MHKNHYMQNCISGKRKDAHCTIYAILHKEEMITERTKNLAFIEEIKAMTGLSYSDMAHKAGFAASTVNRYIRDERLQGLSERTKNGLARVGGYENYEDYIKNHIRKPTTDNGRAVLIKGIVGENLEIFDVSRDMKIPHSVPFAGEENPKQLEALYATGNSGTFFPKRGLIFYYIKPELLTEPVSPDLVSYECLVKLKDGRRFLRIPTAKIPGTDEYILTGVTSSTFQAEVEWASQIVWWHQT